MNNPVCPRCNATAQSDKARFCGKCGYRFPDAAPALSAAPSATSTPLPAPIGVSQKISAGLLALRGRVPKPIFFGLSGALGCLLGALLGELILAFLSPAPPPPLSPSAVDVMFVMDKTLSMDEEIAGVKEGIQQFAREFSGRGLQARQGLLAFGDRLFDSEPEILHFGGEVFTSDTAAFSNQVAQIQPVDGVDLPESSLDAVAQAARQPFRPDAKKIIVLITDAAPHLPDKEITDPSQITQLFKERGIDQFHVVTKGDLMRFYTPLQSVAPGQTFVLDEEGRSGFDRILAGIGSQIAQSIQSVSGSARFDASQARRVLLVTALWTALLALGIALFLLAAQKLYLRQPLRFDKQMIYAATGGALAGFIAGSFGQLLYTGGGQSEWARVLGWTFLGACLGWGLSFAVPNVHRKKSLLGGALGGFIGVLMFLFVSARLSEVPGRLAGALLLGFGIGFMLALVEMTTRKAWLEVARGDNETWIINLGEAPVRVGSREISEIYVREIVADAHRFRLENGKVLRDILSSNQGIAQTIEVHDGDVLNVGETKIILRAIEEIDEQNAPAKS